MSCRTGWGFTTDDVRSALSRHLVGHGVELGPGHHPYVVTLPATAVRYVDRWTPAESLALFPELGVGAEFPEPDIVANLDQDRLAMLPDASEDFVVASHVFEHVANPLALLLDCHRVLRPGGVMILLLPDMRRSSDHDRLPTTLDHLLTELHGDVRAVDEAHLREYARDVQHLDGGEAELAAQLDLLSRRSFHVHCWTEEHFFPVLEHAAADLGAPFELVELLLTEDYPRNNEFGYVLRRGTVELKPEQAAERLTAQRRLLDRVRGLSPTAGSRTTEEQAQHVVRLERTIAGLERTVTQLEHRLARFERYAALVRSSPVHPLLRAVRRLRARKPGGSTG
jgi:predicted SAM-dependent methyltransferase